MTAIEKIKWLESKEVHYQGHPEAVFTAVCEDNKFLLKSFKVMREIAIEKTIMLINEPDLECQFVLDQEFEERMSGIVK